MSKIITTLPVYNDTLIFRKCLNSFVRNYFNCNFLTYNRLEKETISIRLLTLPWSL